MSKPLKNSSEMYTKEEVLAIKKTAKENIKKLESGFMGSVIRELRRNNTIIRACNSLLKYKLK